MMKAIRNPISTGKKMFYRKVGAILGKGRIRITTVFILFITLTILACAEVETPTGNSPVNPNLNQWDIPRDQVFDGGPGKDGIPALDNPALSNASESSYLSDDDLVLGYKNGVDMVAYPHKILDWHEIINDNVNGQAIAVTYCPLTGTGIGWDRTIDGAETTFGVSGLLYNSNLIPYDRKTDSNWSQIRLDCVNGVLKGNMVQTFPLVETTWKTWRSMYPETKLISISTGFNRNYNRYPYGDYRTNNNNIIFPFQPDDNRLGAKERVHGIIIDKVAKAYRFGSFSNGTALIEDLFRSIPLVVVGNKDRNFIVSFKSTLANGTVLKFEIAPEHNQDPSSPIILIDDQGNKWDIFGVAVSGPLKGQKLLSTTSFIGYWFSWGAFYPGLDIYSD